MIDTMYDHSSAPIKPDFPTWLIRSKVYPTRQRIDILERPSLVERLCHFKSSVLTLVHAPAGYGKSTLLSAWRNQLIEGGAKVCWLSLDKEDNESFQLLTYIAFSLSEGGIDFQKAEATDQSLFQDSSQQSLLSMVNYVIELQQEEVILIFDDFENLEQEAIQSVIKPLLDYAPENLHIAIASRDDRKLKITNLETKGLVTRIQAEHLCFNFAELVDFFAEQIPEERIQHIYQVTEGWPVTIQMLKNSSNVDLDIQRILDNFSGSSDLITSYLSEQIFDNLEEQLQSFLLDISLLDRISYEFANHLRNSKDSITFFELCKPLSTLVLPVDQIDNTFRLHPLFREYLYDRLLIAQPSRAIELHQRTAQWFDEQGDIVKAVKHSLLAADPQRAIQTVNDHGGLTIWLREGLTRLRAALKLMSRQTINSSPRIMAVKCLINIKDGKVYQARLEYDEMRENYARAKSQYDPKEQGHIDHEFILLESVLSMCEGKVLSEELCDHLNHNIARIEPSDHMTLGHHYTLLCITQVQRGLFTEARHHAEQATDQFKRFGSIYGEAYINFHLGDISFAEGNSVSAEQFYQIGLNLARQHFNDDKGMKLVANVLIAELKYEQNQINKLPSSIESMPKQLEESEAWFDVYAAGYVTISNIEYQRYGLDAALRVLQIASIYAEDQKLVRLINLLTLQKVSLLIRAGLNDQAARTFNDSGIEIQTYSNPEEMDIAWRERDAAVLVITRLQIRRREFAEALSFLEQFSSYAKEKGQIASCIRYSVLECIANYYLCEYEDAWSQLHQALSLSLESGFVRSFLDESNELGNILNEYLTTDLQDDDGTKAHAIKIIEAFSGSKGSSRQEDLLSKREQEILAQLSHGYSNKVIARNIAVSENTVRFHLKNLFTKLHVRNRLQAVSEARKRNIL
ncbi:MAG: LuxR C-terminal-related transcriptional regulator [Halioglobus sp.]